MADKAQTHDGYVRVRDYLVNAIKEHAFEPGQRMPTERQLAEQLDVSRAVTRRALAEVEAEGLILRLVGRGTFVRPSSETSSVVPVFDGAVSPAEYIDARICFEPELPLLIAINATSADFERMEDCLKRGEKATTREEFEIWDAAFHLAMAFATHNKLTTRMYDMIHAVRHEQAMWGALRQLGQTPDQRGIYQREHREIFASLKQRDAERASELMTQHIRATRRRLLDF
ncbi:MAG: FadR family transcriptional regulator [Glaciimonas sp.]|nr:FadR family transcriptional regulator [Glaciimonas sp.]